MKIGLVTPAPPRSRYGNRVTALRWARILRKLGHSVSVKQAYEGERLDLLVALHARRSYASITRFRGKHPNTPIIVALTGTDLYRDLRRNRHAQKSLDIATRIVALQPKALEELREHAREKARVIYQSVALPSRSASSKAGSSHSRRWFDVCVIGHLRAVKDPFRTAMASRLLPATSRVRVLQVGGAMTKQMAARVREEEKINPRYRWLREQPHWRVRRVLARSRLCVLSSRMEGGANALGEAIAAGVPVLASRIPGSVGILGEDYPGYFEVGDTRSLAELLIRAECDGEFLSELKNRCRRSACLFEATREEKAWSSLLAEVFEPPKRFDAKHHGGRGWRR